MKKADLLKTRKELEERLAEVNRMISAIELSEKPFEAVIFGYSSPGRSSLFFKTEEKAREKYDEYSRKDYYRNGRVNGTALYRHNEDGTRTLLDHTSKSRWFKLPELTE